MKYFLTGAGRVIYSAVIFLLSTAASRYFSVDGYSDFKEFYMYLLIGISVSAFAAVNTLFYFRKRSFKTAFTIGAISLILTTALYGAMYFFRRTNSITVNILIFPSVLAYMMLEASLISEGRQKHAFMLNIAEALSFALPLAAVIILKQGMAEYLKYIALLFALKLPVYAVSLYYVCGRSGKDYPAGEVAAYSAPLFLNGFFGAVSKQSDKYLVSMLFSGRIFAEYSSGAFEIPLVSRFVNGYFHSCADDVRKLMEENDKEGLRRFFAKSTDILFLALGFISALFIANSRQLMEILYTSRYADAYLYFSIYMTVFPLRLIPFGFIMSMYGKTKELFLLSVADAISTVLLTLFLIRFFGPAGGAAAYAAATILQIGLMLFILRPVFPSGRFISRYALMFLFFAAEMIIRENTGFLTGNILPLLFAACSLFLIRRMK